MSLTAKGLITECAILEDRSKEFRAFLLTPVPAAGYSVAIIAAILEFWLWHALGPSFWAQTFNL